MSFRRDVSVIRGDADVDPGQDPLAIGPNEALREEFSWPQLRDDRNHLAQFFTRYSVLISVLLAAIWAKMFVRILP
jgi:hypothetical protein